MQLLKCCIYYTNVIVKYALLTFTALSVSIICFQQQTAIFVFFFSLAAVRYVKLFQSKIDLALDRLKAFKNTYSLKTVHQITICSSKTFKRNASTNHVSYFFTACNAISAIKSSGGHVRWDARVITCGFTARYSHTRK